MPLSARPPPHSKCQLDCDTTSKAPSRHFQLILCHPRGGETLYFRQTLSTSDDSLSLYFSMNSGTLSGAFHLCLITRESHQQTNDGPNDGQYVLCQNTLRSLLAEANSGCSASRRSGATSEVRLPRGFRDRWKEMPEAPWHCGV